MTEQVPESALSDGSISDRGDPSHDSRVRSWRILANIMLAAILGLMILFPPWVTVEMGGSEARFVGYRFLFAPPEGHLTGIDNPRMAGQLLAFAAFVFAINMIAAPIARRWHRRAPLASSRPPRQDGDNLQAEQNAGTVRHGDPTRPES